MAQAAGAGTGAAAAPVTRISIYLATRGGVDNKAAQAPPAAPAPSPTPTSLWGRFTDSVSEAAKELSEIAEAAKNGTEGWKALLVQCATADGQCWHVRRSMCDVIQLRNTLLKDGNPAVRGIYFPTKLTDSAMSLRPAWVDDDSEDAEERWKEIELWLNQALTSCIGDARLATFLSRTSRVTSYTTLERCVLHEAPPEPKDEGDEEGSGEAAGEHEHADGVVALAAGQTFELSNWVVVKGQGEWAKEKGSGSWLCAMSEEGELYVTAEDAQQTRSQGRTKATSAAEEARKAQDDRFARQIAAAQAREAESERLRQLAAEGARLAESEAQKQLNEEDTDGPDQTAGTRARAKARAERKAQKEQEHVAAAAASVAAAGAEAGAGAGAGAAPSPAPAPAPPPAPAPAPMEDDTGANANQEIAESEEANKEDTKDEAYVAANIVQRDSGDDDDVLE